MFKDSVYRSTYELSYLVVNLYFILEYFSPILEINILLSEIQIVLKWKTIYGSLVLRS